MHNARLLTVKGGVGFGVVVGVGGVYTPLSHTPLVTHTPWSHPLPHCMLGYTPLPVNRMTHMTFPHTSFAGGDKQIVKLTLWTFCG